MKKIRTKVLRILLATALVAMLLLSAISVTIIFNMKSSTENSLDTINRDVTKDSTGALRKQKESELSNLATNQGKNVDAKLALILNQTRVVATAAEDIYSNRNLYLPSNFNYLTFPMDTIDFSTNNPDSLDKFSFHIRTPRSLMDSNAIVEEDGVIIKAQLDRNAFTTEQLEELYLTRFLRGALSGLYSFDNGDGTYSGIGATYFCLDSTGVDVLADTLTTKMVEYDAREKTWYKEAKKLKKGEVYWTKPVMDGSGRGIALICAMPVYVGDELIGVAGSGGLIDNIRDFVQETTIGAEGYAFLVNIEDDETVSLITNANLDPNTEIEFSKDNLLKSPNNNLSVVLQKVLLEQNGVDEITLDNERVFIAYQPLSITNWAMLAVIGLDDAVIVEPIKTLTENISTISKKAGEDFNVKIMFLFLILGIFIVVIVVAILYVSVKFSDKITKPILSLKASMGEIALGNLDVKININTGDEIEELGQSANRMALDLKDYIQNLAAVTAEKERIGAELDVAKRIQASMLPCIFPPFPDRPEFDIYATMTPAKEVGGDFYDFFLIDDNHLGLVMADVSGKGVPAALFMVVAKTLLKNCAQTGLSPKNILEKVNNQLCENNEAQMFVTVWLGKLDISTGKLTVGNAGHEHPVVKKAQGDYEIIKAKNGFVLAGMEDLKYSEYEIQLDPGDKLYLYTDGVPEATDKNNELYGNDRMLWALNRYKDFSSYEMLLHIKEDIDTFVGTAPQFDDITMLALEMKICGSKKKTLTIEPSLEVMDEVTGFVEGELETADVPMKVIVQVNIAVDEIFSNIARYSGATEAIVDISVVQNIITLCFSDNGQTYNPLDKADPDITKSADEREVGGLGIFMVKNTMDDVRYRYENGMNILTIIKKYL